MKKINDLKAERTQLTIRYNEIMDMEKMTDELRSEVTEIGKNLDNIEKDITLAERQEEINARTAAPVETVEAEESKDIGEQFRDFLQTAVRGDGPMSFKFRADPILTSTDSAALNKSVLNSVDILKSPGMAFLNEVGVQMYTGLTGNFVIPRASEVTATWPAEGGDASTADMSTTSLTLAARRVSHSQGLTKEMLAQTNPAIYASYVQRLLDGIGNAVANDVMDTLQSDAAGSVYTLDLTTSTNPTLGDLVQMEASLGGLVTNPVYVTTPTLKGFLKKTPEYGTDRKPIWESDEVNGYPAYGVSHANADKIVFADFSHMAVGEWGGIEIVVDPYTRAKQGEIVLTAIGLYDTGCTNPNAVVWSTDASYA